MGLDKNGEGGLSDYFIEYFEFIPSILSIGVVESAGIPEGHLKARGGTGGKREGKIKPTPCCFHLGSAR